MILVLIMAACQLSCNRSQFPTTSRQVRNGKVTYANHPGRDRISQVKARASHGMAYHPREEAGTFILEKMTSVGLPGSDNPVQVATGDTVCNTLRNLATASGKLPDLSTCHRIKVKDGQVLDIDVIHQNEYKVFYRLRSDPVQRASNT